MSKVATLFMAFLIGEVTSLLKNLLKLNLFT